MTTDVLRATRLAQVEWTGCANELIAGYAADGYARVNGIGALVTTFGAHCARGDAPLREIQRTCLPLPYAPLSCAGVGELSAIVRARAPWHGLRSSKTSKTRAPCALCAAADASSLPQNAVAGSFAERVPVIVVSSLPAREVLASGSKLIVHHSLMHGTGYDVFMRMHEPITGAQALLTPQNARAEIERVLAVCLRECVPVYINVPVDVAEQVACGPPVALAARPPSDADALAQAVRLIADWCAGPWRRCITRLSIVRSAFVDEAFVVASHLRRANAAERPVILADIGVQRARAHAELIALVEATGLPCATMSMGAPGVHHTAPTRIC
jgi:TPP-dependent 2-oxoacid decarboxylase